MGGRNGENELWLMVAVMEPSVGRMGGVEEGTLSWGFHDPSTSPWQVEEKEMEGKKEREIGGWKDGGDEGEQI